MAKITPSDRNAVKTVTVKTKQSQSPMARGFKWWEASTKKQLAEELISTAAFLKEMQQFRYRQAGIFSRLYGNAPLFNSIGSQIYKPGLQNNLPIDRPTMNVIQSCVD